MRILALESTAVAGSVALLDEDKLLGEFFCNTKLTHSQTLMPMVEQLFSCTQTSLEDVDLFAVTAGPGSFTGVRIGVASVKGMAMALDKPCAGVSTLEAMAQNLTFLNGVICAVMDARCGQVYNALFRVSGGELIRLTEDRAVSAAQAAADCEPLGGPLYLVGDGAALCYAREEFRRLSPVLLPEPLRFQRASGAAKAALAAFRRGETVSADQLAPIYLRLPQAERELKKRLQK
ncbi:MAG: tRNA (adenosine(37)-N6)-threonylcarbamoyltransferase complex dimerization subunit type 1 TsaB [Hydrogeniiclostridium sp.]|nr:tRNA (adenosine(37)-N6)-threonylcarbamoyltransferase complex dimerization subunit type 1 TsaB [Clostridiales bacterium]